MVGVAVNVTVFPIHVGFVPPVNAMETAGVPDAFTIIVRELEVVLMLLDPNVKVIFGRMEPVIPDTCVQAPAPVAPSA